MGQIAQLLFHFISWVDMMPPIRGLILIFMPKEDTIKIDGKVEELLPNMHFHVVLQNGLRVIAHLCGKMRMRNIRVLVGDTVTVEMSPYDLTKARIIYRQK